MSNPSVLIVDDDSAIRAMVRAVLNREGFAVEDASTGNDAIALMAAKPYDAVVLDVMMRDGAGEDVLRALASMRPDVKCVVVISASSPATIDGVDIANVQAKFRKPFDITQLVEAIRNCLLPSPVADPEPS